MKISARALPLRKSWVRPCQYPSKHPFRESFHVITAHSSKRDCIFHSREPSLHIAFLPPLRRLTRPLAQLTRPSATLPDAVPLGSQRDRPSVRPPRLDAPTDGGEGDVGGRSTGPSASTGYVRRPCAKGTEDSHIREGLGGWVFYGVHMWCLLWRTLLVCAFWLLSELIVRGRENYVSQFGATRKSYFASGNMW